MSRWATARITELPVVSDGESDDPVWYPVRRRAKALTAGTMLLVVGSPDGPFASSWNPAHFADIPRPS